MIAILLVVAGIVGLTLFGWFCWPPLALLPASAACVVAGLWVDWEALRGKSSSPPRRP